MRRFLLPLFCWLWLVTPAVAQNWARMTQRAEASTVSITYPVNEEDRVGTYQCSGVVIDQERQDYFINDFDTRVGYHTPKWNAKRTCGGSATICGCVLSTRDTRPS